MSSEKPIERVVDMIAELQAEDPTMPLEVWSIDDDGAVTAKYRAISVFQMTPTKLAILGLQDDRPNNGPFPTVIFVEPK